MAQLNKVIQIEKYHEGLAAGVAKMWNLSRDGWGGDTRVMTEEQVKKKEANSDNIELYLALDGEEVVGYCGLSEYKEDTGSLYIPLLNVRPDYQGHKIGKKLVLQALDKTVELGWPRLDLYTWAGNTKAVPLYKKCGFFWEDRDDSTHLMNFIPQVLNTPLLKPVFESLDWYEDSTRLIEVKPDGVKENGFTFYEYSWQNEETSARVQFERTSRGISLIETDEFILQIKMADHEVIQEEEREFEITVVNKGGSPLNFKANGTDTGRIKYDFAADQMVENESTITASFTVEKGEEPSHWRTHPSIKATISVNGLECELKLGVFPINPAKIEGNYSGNLSFLDKATSIDVEITNNLRENADFQIDFPVNEQVVLTKQTFTVEIPARGRKTVSVPLTIKQHGFYNPELTITATKNDEQKLTFQQDISVAFKGLGEKFGGESKDFWHIFNGLGQINVRKRDLLTSAARNNEKNQPFAFMTPKLGKPYSLEFTKKKPSSVTWEINDSSIDMKISLESAEMEGLLLTQTYHLFGDGIVHTWAEVENIGESVHPEVAFSQPVYHELEKVYFPLDGEVVHFTENRIMEIGELDSERITGNWYFCEGQYGPIGLAWSKDSSAGPESWQFIIEDHFGKLEPGAKAVSGTITLSLGAFQSVEEFIAYAEQVHVGKKPEKGSELSFKADQLVIQPDADLEFTLKTYRNSYLDGTLKIGNEIHEITAEMEKTSHSMTVPFAALQPLSIVDASYEGNGTEARFKELLLSPSGSVTSETDGNLIIDNGIITLKADPNFYPGIYSMKVNGHEWLDHSYPELTAKSWWNPWAGGMKTAPNGINTFSLLKETSHAEMVEKKDSEGNKWTGLAITTEFKEHKQWNGVQYTQYYLMLPGVPIVASFAEVKDAGGKNLAHEVWITDLFIGGDTLTDVGISVSNNKQAHAYHAGKEEIALLLDEDSYFTSNSCDDKFYMISNNDAYPTDAYTNKEVLQLVSRHKGEFEKSAPLFLLFDERKLTGDLLKKLRRFQF
ncbi:GNAT family N-acetyltransferase [Mesobacillus subterraneus]|uniref:GNAT family N-acetyltransferase n=1 Tax=Mesobacillus subterraneus TaxID=285983 RepID=UPI00203B9704|nr:GNAT family N-acetyltransferase [Mesobacillus subterraneus]MCM3574646.1 GNAT family N-acetyltransferase [Mesobacillus subterraneus]